MPTNLRVHDLRLPLWKFMYHPVYIHCLGLWALSNNLQMPIYVNMLLIYRVLRTKLHWVSFLSQWCTDHIFWNLRNPGECKKNPKLKEEEEIFPLSACVFLAIVSVKSNWSHSRFLRGRYHPKGFLRFIDRHYHLIALSRDPRWWLGFVRNGFSFSVFQDEIHRQTYFQVRLYNTLKVNWLFEMYSMIKNTCNFR